MSRSAEMLDRRDALVAADTPAEMALHLLEKYAEDENPKAMRTLSRALAHDLRSPLVSRQPGKLEARWRRMFSRVRLEREEVNILRGLLRALQKPRNSDHSL